MLNILYLGPNNSEWAQINRPVSLAAAKWSRGFLTALSRHSNLIAVSHSHEQCWPKGRLFWRGYDARLFPAGWPCVPVNYPCLFRLREVWWRFAYAAKAKRVIAQKKIDVVLTYNCNGRWQAQVLRAIRKACPRVKIIPIILDGDDPRKDDWGWIRRAARYSNAFVTLSWWMHQNVLSHTGLASYHFDGGADGWRGIPPAGNESTGHPTFFAHTLVHTGALDQWRGLDFMIDVVEMLTARRKDVKFVFCGKTSEMVLKEIFKDNPQVELPGFVSEDEMCRICNSADVLLNVRDPNHPDNILNYPSKLPHYLSFGRPVVSTRLKSLSPDYDEVVFFEDEAIGREQLVDGYVSKIEEILAWNAEKKIEVYNKIKNWFTQRKSWDVMVGGLISWLSPLGASDDQTLVGKHRSRTKPKVLCFHPALAPYRLDFFNLLGQRVDLELCFLQKNLLSQKFDVATLMAKLKIKTLSVLSFIIRQRNIPIGAIPLLFRTGVPFVLTYECSPITLFAILVRKFRNLITHSNMRRNYKIWTFFDDSPDLILKRSGVRLRVRNWVMRNVEGVIVPSGLAEAAYHSLTTGVRQQSPKFAAVPIIHDTRELRKNEKEIFAKAAEWRTNNLKDGERAIFFVGRLTYVKNLEWLLERVRDTRWPKNCRLYIVGDGELEEALAAKAKVLEVEDQVVFCGREEGDRLQVRFAAADILILASLLETFGAVVSEALQWGAKVLVSDRVGAKSLVETDKNGEVFEFGNEDDFYVKLNSLVRSVNNIVMTGDKGECFPGIRPPLQTVELSECLDGLVKAMEYE